MKIKLRIFLAGVITSLVAFNSSLVIRNYDVDTKLENKIKLVLVTDLHSCKYGKNQEKLINEIKAMNPDAILLGGDIFDDVHPNDNTRKFIEGINGIRSYYVTGNHEYWSDDVEGMIDFLEDNGVTVLEGDVKTLEVNNEKINICGVTDPDIIRFTDSNYDIYSQLEDVYKKSDNGNYNILLAHRPELIDTYNHYNFDLILSGHAHGGQFRIPLLLNGLFAPNQGFFPKYAGGRYDFEDNIFIVSRGLARETTMLPRIFNRPELVVINLE